ncbi:MAG: hypothetical protein KGS61_13805 [Verrucomicrobia bacterium]|nr:hypothetical protein [Verrucomicrobiota bacterium]
MPHGKNWLMGCLWASLSLLVPGRAAEALSAGPFAAQFPLTLGGGWRIEAGGPLMSYQVQGPVAAWTFSPILAYRQDPETDTEEFDFAYPLLTYHRFGTEYRCQLFQLFSLSGGRNQRDQTARQLTLFPFYFQQRSVNPEENYTAVLPFYGHLRHRLFRDDIRFVLLPLYVQTRNKDILTDNYLLPFIHVRHGDALRGWQVWPLIGHEHKGITTLTNGFNEVQTVGGHDKFFALWPLFFNQHTGIGTDNPEHTQILLPFYSLQRSPHRDSTTWLWPFFTLTDDRERKYREWDSPWPLIVFARGEGKTANRVWPLFSQARAGGHETAFYLWPLYRSTHLRAAPLDRERVRILFYLYSHLTESNTVTGTVLRRTDLWPLYTAHLDHDGLERHQFLALLEPFVPNNRAIARSYSSLWDLWHWENNPRTGASSQALLWNLYRRERTPDTRKCSLLFGLFQYQSTPRGRRWRLFYLPVAHAAPAVRAHRDAPS